MTTKTTPEVVTIHLEVCAQITGSVPLPVGLQAIKVAGPWWQNGETYIGITIDGVRLDIPDVFTYEEWTKYPNTTEARS